jgi:hypothetical protein
VQRALGGSVITDGYLADCVDASNAWCHRKRLEAGYTDPPDDDAPAPSPDVAMGATLYAVALWRERASTDGFASFEELSGFAPTGGTGGQIRKLLGIGRGRVDAPAGPVVNPLRPRAWRP